LTEPGWPSASLALDAVPFPPNSVPWTMPRVTMRVDFSNGSQ
jgi:hypothetical protein